MLLIFNINSQKSFVIFVSLYFIGCLTIYFNYYAILIPCGMVFIYSLILLIAQNCFKLSLAQDVKSSPYFMGFLFTLAALVNIFYSIKLDTTDIITTFNSIIVPQIGTAILTTIIGLVGRQFIISFDPAHEVHETLYHLATVELKENVSSYRMAQHKLIELIENFTEHHGKLLEIEKQATKDHIEVLSKTSKSLTEIGKKFPNKINSFLDSLDQFQEKFNSFLNFSCVSILEGFAEKIENASKSIVKEFYQSFNQSISDFQSKLDLMGKNVENAFAKTHKFLNGLPDFIEDLHQKNINQILSSVDTSMEQMKTNAVNINNEFLIVRESIGVTVDYIGDINNILNNNIGKNFQSIDKEMQNALDSLKETSEKVKSNFFNFTENIGLMNEKVNLFSDTIDENIKLQKDKIELFKDEILQIDEFVGSFIDVMKRRYLA